MHKQQKNQKIVIKNQKLGEFNVTILKGQDEYDGIIQLTKTGNSKPFIYKIDIDFNSLKNASDIIRFEDFNFDGEKEIVIYANMNEIYIYDRKTGKEKNLFEKTYGYGVPKETYVKNFINTHRGEYEINKAEMTIKISGSCGVGCGSEETYRGNGDGALNLTRKCEWNE